MGSTSQPLILAGRLAAVLLGTSPRTHSQGLRVLGPHLFFGAKSVTVYDVQVACFVAECLLARSRSEKHKIAFHKATLCT